MPGLCNRESVNASQTGRLHFYRKIGLIASAADEPDYEEAFERFKQAVLISDDREARNGLARLRNRLRSRLGREELTGDLASHRNRLLRAVTEFLALLPPPRRKPRR